MFLFFGGGGRRSGRSLPILRLIMVLLSLIKAVKQKQLIRFEEAFNLLKNKKAAFQERNTS